jgi:hypothetical protein
MEGGPIKLSLPPHKHEWRVLFVTRDHYSARFYCIHCTEISPSKRIK